MQCSNLQFLRDSFIATYMIVTGMMVVWTTGQGLPRWINMLIMMIFAYEYTLDMASDPHREEPPSKTSLSVQKVPYINCEHVS
jgi:hypothetical protein